jgi:glycosyltransferase involved in cell wall biosynthesis
MEVVVVNDGPDREKAALLRALGDTRVRFLEAPRSGRPSVTRNFGIQHATGEWVALLDDDDVWYPQKLEKQFKALEETGFKEAVLSGVELINLPEGGGKLRPKTHGLNVSAVQEVLFIPGGGPHTSTLLAPKWLFREIPFNETIKIHEDWEWLVDIDKKVPSIMIDEVLAESWMEPGERLSSPGGFRLSWEWYCRNKNKMNISTRARFLSLILSAKAAYDRSFSGMHRLICELYSLRMLKRPFLARLIIPWLLPLAIRNSLSRAFSKMKAGRRLKEQLE